MRSSSTIDALSINTIRTLAIDAVQKANSGHAGAPMGMAAVAYTLWQRFLRYDPANPQWPNRDRFVLSAGHASMLLYALLHLAGVRVGRRRRRPSRRSGWTTSSVSPDWAASPPAIRNMASRTGVETTTGPLGQGCGNSVGMAMAQPLAGRPLQPAGAHRCSTTTSMSSAATAT